MQVRNDSVSCHLEVEYNEARLYASAQRYCILNATTRGYMQVRNNSVSCIQRREVICKCATIVHLVYIDARLYASVQR